MSNKIKSTLSEVNRNVAEVCFNILNTFDNTRWKNRNQLVYSTVVGWDTAYEAYLVSRRLDNVKFPFACLTREVTQETYKLWNNPLLAHASLEEGNTTGSVKTVKVKPVKVNYNLAIYDQKLEDIESLADIIMTQGHETQRLDYYSEILEQDSRITFNFQEPIHEMIPDKSEKRKGKGFVYGLNLPIIVDSVLGIKSESKIIQEAIQKTIINNSQEEIQIINEDC